MPQEITQAQVGAIYRIDKIVDKFYRKTIVKAHAGESGGWIYVDDCVLMTSIEFKSPRSKSFFRIVKILNDYDIPFDIDDCLKYGHVQVRIKLEEFDVKNSKGNYFDGFNPNNKKFYTK